MKRLSVFFLPLIYVLSLGCGESKVDGSSNNLQSDIPIENKLGVLDGWSPNEKSARVNRIRKLLDHIASTDSVPVDTIAEYTSRAKGVLYDNGIEKTCTEILEDLNKQGSASPINFQDKVTLYLMTKTAL